MSSPMHLWWTFDAARRFATLSTEEASHVLQEVSQPADDHPVDDADSRGVIRYVRVHDLFVGALVESDLEQLTILHLGGSDAHARVGERARAFAMVKKRATIGGIDMNAPAERILMSVQVLMHEYQQLSEMGFNAGPRTRTVKLGATTRLVGDAKRWRTSDARGAFKELLEEATTRPQVIERDGEELVVIARDLLDRYAAPLSGAALAARFRNSGLPALNMEHEPVLPDRELSLGKATASERAIGASG